MILLKKINVILALFIVSVLGVYSKNETKDKILFVVTSHAEKGNTGEKTGYFLSEVAHPWKVLTDAGYEIDFVSPQGGNPPVDGFDLKDSINNEFWTNTYYQNKIKNSLTPSEVNPSEYVAIFYAGGHGAMWDFPNNEALASIASRIYENNGVVSAVCHGPAGIVNIKLSNGKYLIDGKKVGGFSDTEEDIIGLTDVVPFLLEDKLKERGAIYENTAPWQSFVVVDQNLITGQNPQSATAVGEKIKETLATKKNKK